MEQSTCADQFQEQVVEKYSEMVYRLAFSQLRSKTDADDVYQEVFFRYFLPWYEYFLSAKQFYFYHLSTSLLVIKKHI